MPGTSTKRFCVISPDGGQITVRLQADNTLIAGGNFTVFNPAGASINQFSMQTGSAGMATEIIDLPVGQLQGCMLSWALLCCAGVSTFDAGTVTMDFIQDDAVCPLTKAAQWELTNVPACENSGNAATQIKGSTGFSSAT
jgi:hypothetical protein